MCGHVDDVRISEISATRFARRIGAMSPQLTQRRDATTTTAPVLRLNNQRRLQSLLTFYSYTKKPRRHDQRGLKISDSINVCCIGNVCERPAGRTSCALSCANHA